MSITRSQVLGVLSVGLFLLIPDLIYAQSFKDYSWGVTSPNVATVPWTNQQIADFLNTVTDSLVTANVGDFKFIDLDGDGQLELVTTVDFSGRSIFNTFAIVRRIQQDFAIQQIDTQSVTTLEGLVADFDGDGKQELFVPRPLTPYLGAGIPQAEWISIYAWNGILFVDASSQFSTYYESTVLPGLKEALENLVRTAPDSIETAVAQMQYDKILRVSGQDPSAGLNQALTWATSANPIYRIFAAAILADVGSADALKALPLLATDQDSQVVIYAQAALQKVPDLHFTTVRIDVRPGSAKNPIQLKARGTIPVAILSSPTFNAPALVDTRSLTFGSAGSEQSLNFCNPNGTDVDGDGILDLMCHFDVSACGFQLGDAVVTLRGKLKDGTAIKGMDSIVIIDH